MATMTQPSDIQADARPRPRQCRFCGSGLQRTFVDLGLSPLCETYPAASDLQRGEHIILFMFMSARIASWCSR
jgi:hypothetical protein